MPRPFYVTDRFTPLKLTDGYGMPSGNTQGPATLLLTLAKNGPRWIWAPRWLAPLPPAGQVTVSPGST